MTEQEKPLYLAFSASALSAAHWLNLWAGTGYRLVHVSSEANETGHIQPTYVMALETPGVVERLHSDAELLAEHDDRLTRLQGELERVSDELIALRRQLGWEDGESLHEETPPSECPDCRGSGVTPSIEDDRPADTACPTCRGTGRWPGEFGVKEWDTICPACDGTGRVVQAEEIGLVGEEKGE